MNIIPNHTLNEKDRVLMMKLYQEVNDRVNSLPKSRLISLKIKIFILPLIYIVFYLLALLQNKNPGLFYVFYALMGLMVVVIFVNLIHEACHGNLFKSRKLNSAIYYLFDFLGANSFIWKQRHLLLHHRFPNTDGWDADIEQKGLVSIYSGESKQNYHRFQHYYIFLLYPLFLINWLFVRDFRDFFSDRRIIHKVVSIPIFEYFKMFLFKLSYLFMLVGIPWLYAGFSLIQSLLGLLILTVTGSLFALIVLLTPHINVTNQFPVVEPTGEIQFSWFYHQFITTNDIENTNWVIRNLMGNFNYHLAHHLFPQISRVYAPEVTLIVKEFARINQLPYRSFPLSVALKKHYQLIRTKALQIDDIEL